MSLIDFSVKLLLTLSLSSTFSVPAAQWSFRAPHDAVPQNAEEYKWAEERVELPAYPNKEKMVRLDFDRSDRRFEFFIDPETLTVGEDGVIRYVLLLRSPSGSENLMFEGMRCTERDYKTFAFGTAEGKFRQLRSPAWKEITQTSNNWFRHDLWKKYFCYVEDDLTVKTTREGILQRLAIPAAR